MDDSSQTGTTDPSGGLAARVTILGAGQMGLVCAGLLAADGNGTGPSVTLWSHDEEEAASILQTRRSERLPGFVLPESAQVSFDDAGALAGADLIVSAVPTQATRGAWERVRARVPAGAAAVSVAKGIETRTLLRPTQVIAEALADDPDGAPRPMGVLSGPTIAAELARCLPATLIAASDDPRLAARLQVLFSTSYMRVYTNDDMLGVEIAGATKNVIALAAGILDGLQAGSNAKSALLARGLAEIARLGAAMGARPDTFFGIAGVGDLATTCFSPEGRNRSCGEALGKGEKLEAYLSRTRSTVEGIETTRAVAQLAAKYRVEMPITRAVHAVLFDQMDPLEAIGRLMSRELRDERLA